MTTNADVVAALNSVLSRVGVPTVRSLGEFDSLLLLRIFRRLFIGLPSDVLTEPVTRADHERNFAACIAHLSKSVLMMDLSHIDGAALAAADIEATRNLLEILDELHEIFQHETDADARQSTPPRRRRGSKSPETAPRTHSRTRTRTRTAGSSRISLADDDDGASSELAARALDDELAPWGRGRAADGDSQGGDGVGLDGPENGVRRLPSQFGAVRFGRTDNPAARMRRTYGAEPRWPPPHADSALGRAPLGRLRYRAKGDAHPSMREAEATYTARVRADAAAAPVRRLVMGDVPLRSPRRPSSATRVRARGEGARATTVEGVLRARSAPRARWAPTVPVAAQPTSWARALTYHGVEGDVRRLARAMHTARARTTLHAAQAKAHARGAYGGGGVDAAQVAISVGTDPRTGKPVAVAASATADAEAQAGSDGDEGADADGGRGEDEGEEGMGEGWREVQLDDEEHMHVDDRTMRAYSTYASLLKQHTAELRRTDQLQRTSARIGARNALRDERIARMRGQRAMAELETREASLLSHRCAPAQPPHPPSPRAAFAVLARVAVRLRPHAPRALPTASRSSPTSASAGYAYRRQLYRLAAKLQRERGWIEQSAEASRAYAQLRASDNRQAAAEHYYHQQIALLEVRARQPPACRASVRRCTARARAPRSRPIAPPNRRRGQRRRGLRLRGWTEPRASARSRSSFARSRRRCTSSRWPT